MLDNMKRSHRGQRSLGHAFQMRDRVAMDHVEAKLATLTDDQRVLVHAARRDSLVEQQFEPFATAASGIDHGAACRCMCGAYVGDVRGKPFTDLRPGTAEGLLKRGVQPRRSVFITGPRKVRNGGRE